MAKMKKKVVILKPDIRLERFIQKKIKMKRDELNRPRKMKEMDKVPSLLNTRYKIH